MRIVKIMKIDLIKIKIAQAILNLKMNQIEILMKTEIKKRIDNPILFCLLSPLLFILIHLKYLNQSLKVLIQSYQQ